MNDNGDCMLVREFMEGGTMHDALKAGSVTWKKWCAASLQRPPAPVHSRVCFLACG